MNHSKIFKFLIKLNSIVGIVTTIVQYVYILMIHNIIGTHVSSYAYKLNDFFSENKTAHSCKDKFVMV